MFLKLSNPRGKYLQSQRQEKSKVCKSSKTHPLIMNNNRFKGKNVV